MAVIVDELGLVIPGNVVKKFDGTDTTLRVTRAQLDQLIEAAQGAVAIFGKTEPSPPEPPKTAELNGLNTSVSGKADSVN